MQEEVNEQIIGITIRAANVTVNTLQGAMKHALESIKYNTAHPIYPKGKQTLLQLMKQNAGLTSIEITDENIKAFEQTAKKYYVDFALYKVEGEESPKYFVFFKSRDTDLIAAAFKEFTSIQFSKAERDEPVQDSVLKELKRQLAIMSEQAKEKKRQKTKEKELDKTPKRQKVKEAER